GTLSMPVATARTVEGSISGGNWVIMESRMRGCSSDRVRCTVTSHPALPRRLCTVAWKPGRKTGMVSVSSHVVGQCGTTDRVFLNRSRRTPLRANKTYQDEG